MYQIQALPESAIAEMMADPNAASELRKALEAGYGVDAGLPYTGVRAMTHESLEPHIAEMLPSLTQATLYRMLQKASVAATVQQWVAMTSYGSRWGHTVAEGATPGENTPALARVYSNVRHMRDLCVATDVALAVDTIASPTTVLEEAGIKNQIHQLNRALYFNDGVTIPSAIKGILAYAADGVSGVMNRDQGGTQLTAKAPLYSAGQAMRSRGAILDTFLSHTSLLADFSALYEQAERIIVTSESPKLYAGATFAGVNTPFGRVDWESDIFNDVRLEQAYNSPEAAPGATAPASPTLVSAVSAGTGGNIPAGAYFYGVMAVYADGHSATVYSSQVNVAPGEMVTLIVTPNDVSTTGIYVYRSAKDAADESDCRCLWQAPMVEGTATFLDSGFFVPGCTDLIMAPMNPTERVMGWAQLIPTIKVPVARLADLRERFVIATSGAFCLFKPRWIAVLRNILPRDVSTGEGDLPAWNPLGVTLGS